MIRSFTCTYAVLVWYPSSSVTASQLLLTGSSFFGCTCSRSFSATWTTRSPVFFFVCLCEPDNPRRQFNVRLLVISLEVGRRLGHSPSSSTSIGGLILRLHRVCHVPCKAKRESYAKVGASVAHLERCALPFRPRKSRPRVRSPLTPESAPFCTT
ncbi:hypothetical protein PF005_g30451, partial [Phytophthora fragariae]